MELVAIFWKRSKREKRVNQKQEVLTSLWQEPSLQVLLVFNGGAIALTDQEVPVAVQLCRPETTLMLMLLPLGEGAERKSKQCKNKFLPFSSFPVSPQYLPLAQNPIKRQLTSEPGKCSLQASFHMPWSTKEVIGGQEQSSFQTNNQHKWGQYGTLSYMVAVSY